MPTRDSAVATQNPGALSSGIGIDASMILEAAYVESGQYGHAPNTIAGLHRIALGLGADKIMDAGGTPHSMKLVKAAADVAPGGVVASGYTNNTGKTVKTGQYCWAVASAGLLLEDGTTEPADEPQPQPTEEPPSEPPVP